MKKTLLSFAALALVFASLQGQPVWTKVMSSKATTYIDPWACKPIVDAQGNVYVGGNLLTQSVQSNNSPVIIKLNAAGDTLWRYIEPVDSIDNPATPSYFSAITFDPQGNIYGVGVARFDEFTCCTKPFVVKLSPNGNLIWRKTMLLNTYTDNLLYYPVLATDISGNVYFTGRTRVTSSQVTAQVFKISSAGDSLWTNVLSYLNERTWYYGIAVNSAGNKVYAIGDSYSSALSVGVINTIDAQTGVSSKTRRYATNPGSNMEAMFFDEDDNSYISRYDYNGAALLFKFDDTLGQTYMLKYEPSGGFDSNFGKILKASNGNIYAIGYTYTDTDSGSAIFLRLLPDGTVLDTVILSSQDEEYFYDGVEIDNELFFTGAIVDANGNENLKVWRTDLNGNLIESYVFSNASISYSTGWWITADNSHVYVTGNYRGTNNIPGILAFKFNPQQGITVGIPPLDLMELSVYPNPFTDMLAVRVAHTEQIQLRVYDAKGKLMYETAWLLPEVGDTHQLLLDDVPNGIYFLNAIDKQGRTIRTKKLIRAGE